MKKLGLLSVLFTSAQASMAFAQDSTVDPCGGSGQVACAVPEISALEGTAALAVVAALVLLAWERRRRAA